VSVRKLEPNEREWNSFQSETASEIWEFTHEEFLKRNKADFERCEEAALEIEKFPVLAELFFDA
jgi:hypothetical protein